MCRIGKKTILLGRDSIKGTPKLGFTTYSGSGKYINEGCIMVNWDAFPETDKEWEQMSSDDVRKPPGGSKDQHWRFSMVAVVAAVVDVMAVVAAVAACVPIGGLCW